MSKGRVSVDQLHAVLGEGPVTFGGDIVLDGYKPSEYNLSAQGRSLHLRVMEGLRSTVNASLELRGPITAPVLSGTVDVLTASYSPRIQTGAGYFDLFKGSTDPTRRQSRFSLPKRPASSRCSSQFGCGPGSCRSSRTIPHDQRQRRSGHRRDDIQDHRHRPDLARSRRVGLRRQPLSSRGRPDRLHQSPGLRSILRHFAGDARPYAGQNYDVNLRLSGTFDKLQPSISSEPWLPEFQIISLLLGENADVGRSELLARTAPEKSGIRRCGARPPCS
jgi:hypothetical protein